MRDANGRARERRAERPGRPCPGLRRQRHESLADPRKARDRALDARTQRLGFRGAGALHFERNEHPVLAHHHAAECARLRKRRASVRPHDAGQGRDDFLLRRHVGSMKSVGPVRADGSHGACPPSYRRAARNAKAGPEGSGGRGSMPFGAAPPMSGAAARRCRARPDRSEFQRHLGNRAAAGFGDGASSSSSGPSPSSDEDLLFARLPSGSRLRPASTMSRSGRGRTGPSG